MSFRSRLAWSWTLVVLAICWLPRVHMPINEGSGGHPFGIPYLDKAIHFAIFAVFAALWARVNPSAGRDGWIFLAGLALAVVSELVQELPIISRDAGWMDGVADMLGVALGLIAFRLPDRTKVEDPGA